MKSALLLVSASALALVALASACTSPSPESESLDATSCEGAHFDNGGICRRPDGRFAKKTCCSPDFPRARRSLEAYGCPGEPEPIAVAFFDADSTLRISRSGSPTASSADDVYVLPLVARQLAALSSEGHLIAIVSNQGGVAAGYTDFEVAEGALVYLIEQLHALGADVDYLDFADQKDGFRKPETGMATHLDGLLIDKCGVGIDLERSFMVGDAGYKKNVDGPHPDGRPADDFSNSDRLFAENLGVPFSEPADAFGWADFGFHNIHDEGDLLGLLAAMEVEIAALEESGEDDARLEQLKDEVAQSRQINELD